MVFIESSLVRSYLPSVTQSSSPNACKRLHPHSVSSKMGEFFFFSSHVCFNLLERHNRDTHREDCPSADSLLKRPQRQWQGLKSWGCHLLPPRVGISKKLEWASEPKIKSWLSNMKCGHLESIQTNCPKHPPVSLSLYGTVI